MQLGNVLLGMRQEIGEVDLLRFNGRDAAQNDLQRPLEPRDPRQEG